jgi:hypothetical protein
MILGFTGTRQGLTPAQRAALPGVLAVLPERVLHGGAEGADEEFHLFICECQVKLQKFTDAYCGIVLPRLCQIEIYVAEEDRWDFWTKRANEGDDNLRAAYAHIGDPLGRNRIIANRCGVLFACPAEATEQLRSGTWSTVRYARKAGKPITIITPSGDVVEERR